jgi:3-hydroxyisobutyrate dehydrogenase-like beta-hydroxyacid dehydrogenase
VFFRDPPKSHAGCFSFRVFAKVVAMMLPCEQGQRIGIIGLGLMGTALCERLLEHGYQVFVWNRTREKADSLIARGAVWSDRPTRECDRVLISLYSSPIVADVVSQFSPTLRTGQILIDTTTGEPSDSIALAQRLADMGVHYLEAPISGSSEQTRRGEATVMVGGERATFDACSDLWPQLGKTVCYVGQAGTAAKMKLVSNLILGLNRAALAEGLAFAESIGIEPSAALEILRQSAAYSRVMDIKGQKMLTRDFTPQAKLSQHLKDVRIILKSAESVARDLPLSQTHRQLLERAESAGYGEQDNSAILAAYDQPWRDTD